MNEVFDIKRFGKLMQYEVINYIPRYFKSLLIFASVIFAVWLFSTTVDFDVMSTGRIGLIAVLFIFAVVLAPYIIYKDMNNRKKGYMYAMIPASTLEKLLSMIVVCLICVPVMTYAVLTATDIVLYLLSNLGIGSFMDIHFFNPFYDDTFTVFNKEMTEYVNPVFDNILYFISVIAYTMMFNTIFRKNKVLKTILFNMVVSFAFIMITTTVVSVTSPEFWENFFEDFVSYVEDMNPTDAMNALVVLWRTGGCLLVAIYLTIAYFRIKKVDY